MIPQEAATGDLPQAHLDLFVTEHNRIARVLRALGDQGVTRQDRIVIVVAQLYTRIGIGLARARWNSSEVRSELRLAVEEGREPTFVEALVGDDAVELLGCWPEALATMQDRPGWAIPVLLVVGEHVVMSLLRPMLRKISPAVCN